MEKSEKSAAPAPSSSASGGKEQIEKQARQLAYDVRYKTKQSMSANKGAKMDPAAVRKAYIAQLGKSTGSPPVKARAKEMLLGENYVNVKEFASESVASIIKKVFAEKLDPVGKEDSDVDNDGKKNTKSDKYIKNKREKIGKAIDSEGDKKFKVRVTDKGTGNTYVRMATRAKIAELRANSNISSVEITGHGEPNSTKAEDYLRGELIEKKSKDGEEKKITGKGVNNKKLIKVFPNSVSEEAEPEKDDKTEKQIASKEKKLSIIKKQVLLKKMQAVRQGAGSEIVAHNELEGEMVENRMAAYTAGAGEGSPASRPTVSKKTADKVSRSSDEHAFGNRKKKEGIRLSPTKKYSGKDKGKVVKRANTTGRGTPTQYRKSHEDPDMGRYQKKVTQGSGSIKDLKKEDYQSILDAYRKIYEHHQKDKDGNTIPHEGVVEAATPQSGTGKYYKEGKPTTQQLAQREKRQKIKDLTNKGKHKEASALHNEAKYDNTKSPDYKKKKAALAKKHGGEENIKGHPQYEEKKKEEQEDPRSMGTKYRNIKNKLRSLGIKFAGPTLDELNRYGKETGKATGSLNKRPGSKVETGGSGKTAINVVRNKIRQTETGKPEGQREKIKGEKGRVQPGDRKTTPADTIAKRRQSAKDADAAMRDTRGT